MICKLYKKFWGEKEEIFFLGGGPKIIPKEAGPQQI